MSKSSTNKGLLGSHGLTSVPVFFLLLKPSPLAMAILSLPGNMASISSNLSG
jgi:hypothetical protein